MSRKEIWCETEELKRRVLEKLESQGITWNSGVKATEFSHVFHAPMCLIIVDERIMQGFGKSFYPDAISAEKFLDNETIVIYRKNNEVIALNKSTGKKAIAKCCPSDTFDFEVGAKLALERLFADDKFLHKFEAGKKYIFSRERYEERVRLGFCHKGNGWQDRIDGKIVNVTHEKNGNIGLYNVDPEWCIESPYYNGKVVCVDNICNRKSLIVGKIYEVVEGYLIDEDGDKRPYGAPPAKSIDELSNTAKFIEVVE